METVNGVTVVVYKEHGDYFRFAVLRRTLNWDGWELVKGHIDEGEDAEAAARREVSEETGIEPINIQPLDTMHEWEYERDGTEYQAEYQCFLAQAPSNALIRVDEDTEPQEHSKGHFLNSRDAIDILSHDNQKELLREAVEKLEHAD